MEWNEQKRLLNSQISSGESLLWSGQPRQGLFFRPSDVYLIPSSLLTLAFALFWNFGAWNSNSPPFFHVVGALALVYAVYWLVGRFFVDAWQRSKMFYGVTNERVIIVSGIFSKNVKSLPLRTMTEVSVSERPDLSGTITFGPADDASDWKSKLPFKMTREEPPVYPTLDSIQNVKRVYDIIRNAQRVAV